MPISCALAYTAPVDEAVTEELFTRAVAAGDIDAATTLLAGTAVNSATDERARTSTDPRIRLAWYTKTRPDQARADELANETRLSTVIAYAAEDHATNPHSAAQLLEHCRRRPHGAIRILNAALPNLPDTLNDDAITIFLTVLADPTPLSGAERTDSGSLVSTFTWATGLLHYVARHRDVVAADIAEPYKRELHRRLFGQALTYYNDDHDADAIVDAYSRLDVDDLHRAVVAVGGYRSNNLLTRPWNKCLAAASPTVAAQAIAAIRAGAAARGHNNSHIVALTATDATTLTADVEDTESTLNASIAAATSDTELAAILRTDTYTDTYTEKRYEAVVAVWSNPHASLNTRTATLNGLSYTWTNASGKSDLLAVLASTVAPDDVDTWKLLAAAGRTLSQLPLADISGHVTNPVLHELVGAHYQYLNDYVSSYSFRCFDVVNNIVKDIANDPRLADAYINTLPVAFINALDNKHAGTLLQTTHPQLRELPLDTMTTMLMLADTFTGTVTELINTSQTLAQEHHGHALA